MSLSASLSPSALVEFRDILSRVGDKWALLVVSTLDERSRRFSELKRGVPGISQRMLTLTLRGLERDGLVKRTVVVSMPQRVDYELTPLGRTLLEPAWRLLDWVDSQREVVKEARKRYDTKPGAVPVEEPIAPSRVTPTSPSEALER